MSSHRKDHAPSMDLEADVLDIDAKRRSNSVSRSYYHDWNGARVAAPHETFSSTMLSANEQSYGGGGGGDQSMSTSALRSRSTTLNRSPSQQWSAKANKRKSTVLLESKLPSFMRGNLPKFDEFHAAPSHEKFPPPPMPDDGTGIQNDASYARYFSNWWHSHSRDRHDELVKRTLQRRLLVKNMVVTALAEFVGTFFFLFFALAINTTCSKVKEASGANGDSFVDLIALLVSSLGFGFSLVISAWVFFRVSGGVQNPAITLALTLTGALTWLQFIVLTIVQYVGGIAAAGLISGLYPGTVDSRTTLGPQTTINQGFWLEFFMSAQLIFTVLMLAAEKHRATFLAPVGIGLALFITQLLGQPYTGASVNPARTLGPDVVQRTFSGSCWIYYVSSYAAAIVTSGFFLLLKWVRYETATPDQDADEHGARLARQVMLDTNGNVIGVMDVLTNEEFDAKHGHNDEYVGGDRDDNEKNVTSYVAAGSPPTSSLATTTAPTAAAMPAHAASSSDFAVRSPNLDAHPPAAFVVPSQPEMPGPAIVGSPMSSVVHRQASLHNNFMPQPTRYYSSIEHPHPRSASDADGAPHAR